MKRRKAMLLIPAVGMVFAKAVYSDEREQNGNHIKWVGEVLTRMKQIQPGMTRKDLGSVFTVEGGLSAPLRRTYVSRDCPYFKVDVKFKAVGRPDRDGDGRVTGVEADEDVISEISRPYLEFGHMD